MAISIDTIYQRVLALANKEQRGYVTPQEFNLFANQAQQEIFEQYFYDLNQVARIPGNDYVYADVDDMLEEKLQIFDRNELMNTFGTLPSKVYRVHRIELNNVNCEILRTKDFNSAINGGPLTKPSTRRPIVNIKGGKMQVSDGIGSPANVNVFYFTKPSKVKWGYVVVNKKALYDPTYTSNFELHPSEESELVYRILAFAGIAIEKPQLTQVAAQLEGLKVQQEKQ